MGGGEFVASKYKRCCSCCAPNHGVDAQASIAELERSPVGSNVDGRVRRAFNLYDPCCALDHLGLLSGRCIEVDWQKHGKSVGGCGDRHDEADEVVPIPKRRAAVG